MKIKAPVIIIFLLGMAVLSAMYIHDYFVYKSPVNTVLYSVQKLFSQKSYSCDTAVAFVNDTDTYYFKISTQVNNNKSVSDFEVRLYEYGDSFLNGKIFIYDNYIVISIPTIYDKYIFFEKKSFDATSIGGITVIADNAVRKGIKTVYSNNEATAMNNIEITLSKQETENLFQMLFTLIAVSDSDIMGIFKDYEGCIDFQIDSTALLRGMSVNLSTEKDGLFFNFNVTPNKKKLDDFDIELSNAVDISNLSEADIADIANTVINNIDW